MKKRGDIDAAFKEGERMTARGLRLHLRPNSLSFSRIAITVPRRLCRAVHRNRWKRLIRETFRLNKEWIGPGLDLLAVPMRPPNGFKRQDVQTAFRTILERYRRKS